MHGLLHEGPGGSSKPDNHRTSDCRVVSNLVFCIMTQNVTADLIPGSMLSCIMNGLLHISPNGNTQQNNRASADMHHAFPPALRCCLESIIFLLNVIIIP
ncbi:unnamed protein product, partial [Meganyctiphanes norvegica]